jgi:hypothetical protein
MGGALVNQAAAQNRDTAGPGAVSQTGRPAVSQNPSLPPLQLSPAQRAKIQQAVSSEDTEVSFALKSAKSAQNFQPSVGAKVPGAVKLHPLPRPLVNEMEPLKRYTYVKFKHSSASRQSDDAQDRRHVSGVLAPSATHPAHRGTTPRSG